MMIIYIFIINKSNSISNKGCGFVEKSQKARCFKGFACGYNVYKVVEIYTSYSLLSTTLVYNLPFTSSTTSSIFCFNSESVVTSFEIFSWA
jgi:hypothetical protein